MKVRKPRKLSAVVLSVVLALSMTVGVMPVTPAAANTVGEDGFYTIHYSLNDTDLLGTANLGIVNSDDVTVNEEAKTIKIDVSGNDPENPEELTLTDLGTPTIAHATFANWKSGDDNVATVTLTDGGAIDLTASWDKTEYNVVYDAGGGEMPDDPAPPTTFTGTTTGLESITGVTPTAPAHSVFDDWYTDDGFNNKASTITATALTVLLDGGDTLNLYAKYVPATYGVAFKSSDGETTYDVLPTSYAYSTEESAAITLPAIQTAAAADTGYEWKWSDGTNTYAPGSYSVTGKDTALTFTETQVPVTYKISYEDKDGDAVGTEGSYTVNTTPATITLPDAASAAPANKEFVGWTCSADGDVYEPGDTFYLPIPANESELDPQDVTFTETWAYEKYTLTLNAGTVGTFSAADAEALTTAGFTVVDGSATKDFTVEDDITLPTGLTADGYEFTGWTDDDDSNADITGWTAGDKADAVNVTANWDPVFTATFTSQGNILTGTGYDNVTFKDGSTSITLPAAPTAPEGYHFTGWRIGEGADLAPGAYDVATYFESEPLNNLTFVANWELNSYTINLDVGTTITDATLEEAGDKTGGVYTKSIKYNDIEGNVLDLTSFVPTTTTFSGAYEFGGWTISGSTATSIDLADLDNGATVTVTANWLEKYTVEYDLNGGSYNSETSYTDNLTSATLADPSAYTAIVPTLSGSTLTKWTLAGTNVTAGDISVSDPTAGQTIDLSGIQPGDTVTLTAGWTTSYTVTYLDDDDTPLTLTPSYYLTGTTSITLPAVPTRTGYTVTWSDGVDNDLAGGSSYSIPTTEADLTFTAVYEKTPFTITLTGVSGTDNISAVTTAGFTADSSDYVKTVYVDTPSFTLPTLPDDTTAHMAFKGWRETGSSDEPATITIANTAADALYEPVFAAVPTVTINFTLGTDGEFLAEDLAKLTALGGDATGVTLYADQDADALAALAIIPAPVKTSDNDIFSGWTVSGDSSGAKVMEYEVPAFSTTSNPTVTLTANWTPVADGETEVLKEGADAGTIGASTTAALEDILDVDSGAKAIVKVDVEEADHTGGAVDVAVDGAFAGATGVDTAYLNIDITKYVTTSTQNSEKTEIADLGEVLDIVYDPTGNIPIGKTLDDLGLVVRYHNGQSQTFTKLTAQPASGEEVDGTYWVDSANSLIHIYNRFFSTFALAYTPTLYDVTFDADGGTPVASIRTNKLPSPSAMPTTTKSGYDFNGWFDGNGTQYTGGETVAADLALKAKWTKQATGGGGSGGGSGGGGTTPPSPTPTASADPSPTPTGSPEVSPTPTTDPTTEPTTPPAPLAKGKKFKTSNGMTLISNGDGTAKLSKYKGSGKSLTVDTAKDANGYKYKITSIAAKAAKGNKKLTKLTIGVNVAKIGDYAFYGCEHLGWVYVKSLKLTKASRVGRKSFGKTKKKALFKLKKKYFKKTKAAFKKKSGAKKPRYKKV